MILSYLTEKIADGGMKMLKEIPALVMKGWEEVKDWFGFLQESKGTPGGERAVGLWKKICESYEKLFADSEKVTEETEKGVDEILKEKAGPKVESKKARDDLSVEAPKPLKEKTEPSGEIPTNLAKTVKVKAGKSATPKGAQEAIKAGAMDLVQLRAAAKDEGEFTKLFEKYHNGFPPGLMSLFNFKGFGSKLDKLAIFEPFGITLTNGSSRLNDIQGYFEQDSLSDKEVDEIVAFADEFFFEHTKPDKIKEIVKELHKNRHNLGAPRVMASAFWKVHPMDFEVISDKLGGSLTS